MKLRRFKEKKLSNKHIILSFGILLILLAAFGVYKTFAIYKVEKEYNVLRSKIGDFSSGDIKLAFTVNGEKKPGQKFPTKESRYYSTSVTCKNGATASWNNANWSLTNINTNDNEKIECTIDFDILGSFDDYKCVPAKLGNVEKDGTLTPGELFDCDVKGDGTKTRFKYISYQNNGTAHNEDVAVLIEANAYGTAKTNWVTTADYTAAGGTLSHYKTDPPTYVGNEDYDYAPTDKGPLTAIKQLPTVQDWPNIQLTSTTRNITDETGTVKVSNFQYKKDGVDLAARLLTYQEYQASGIAYITYGWFETPSSSDNRKAYSSGTSAYIASNMIGTTFIISADGTKLSTYPAIEVAKTDIDY